VPSLILLYGFAVFLVAEWFPAARPRPRLAVLLLACVFTMAAFPLSQWVRRQAPQIQAAAQLQHDLTLVPDVVASVAPGRVFVSDLGNWTSSEAGVSADNVAVLMAPRPGEISAIVHEVTLEPNTIYQVEFDAKAVAAVTAELSVDLYAGESYDRDEQHSKFRDLGHAYTHFTTQWNSGRDAPRTAMLRFVTVSMNPIQVRNIVFRKEAPGPDRR
jgi:hypothetical protein